MIINIISKFHNDNCIRVHDKDPQSLSYTLSCLAPIHNGRWEAVVISVHGLKSEHLNSNPIFICSSTPARFGANCLTSPFMLPHKQINVVFRVNERVQQLSFTQSLTSQELKKISCFMSASIYLMPGGTRDTHHYPHVTEQESEAQGGGNNCIRHRQPSPSFVATPRTELVFSIPRQPSPQPPPSFSVPQPSKSSVSSCSSEQRCLPQGQ